MQSGTSGLEMLNFGFFCTMMIVVRMAVLEKNTALGISSWHCYKYCLEDSVKIK